MVASLAWPLVILFAVILLRKQITPLIRSIRKVSFRGVELEIGEELNQLKQDVEEAPGPAIAPIPLPDKYVRLAAISTRAVIIEAWKELEISIRDAATSLGIESAGQKPMEELAREIETEAGIERKVPMSNHIARMRRLRNSMTHDLEREISPNIALEMADLSIEMAEVYRAISARAG